MPNLHKEISRNIELSLQKDTGLLRWKANLFRNNVSDFIYGHITASTLDEDGNAGGANSASACSSRRRPTSRARKPN
jgi:iron complex outermembrane receptor protein